MPYIKPTSDIFIKYLLGTEEHKDLLLSFINAVMTDSGFPLVKSVESSILIIY
ncbi:MAG: PD-(D/E)XK nuclease family transposase [Desulfamplus sp.]|nr:PD-(D/E)XK nuclease family transposase [Desulfamplus sp.]